MRNKDVNDFLALVRKGINQDSKDTYNFEHLNWEKIQKLAKQQTVIGVVAEASLSLSNVEKPPKAINDRLTEFAFLNVKTHLRINRTIKKVFSELQKENIPAVLLKGQSLSHIYPASFMRQCGDIDVYVGPPNFNRALDLALRKWESDSDEKQSFLKHYHFSSEGIKIDLHHTAALRFIPWRKKYFQQWIHNQLKESNCEKMKVGESEILVPSATFNAFFLFYHAWYHFIEMEGIGLRQLCDWSLWLQKRQTDIDRKTLREILEKLGLIKSWQIMGEICVKYLGLDKEFLPFYSPNRDSEAKRMIEVILEEGNFGFYAKGRKDRKKNKIRKLIWATKRNMRIFQIAPIQVSYRYLSMLYFGIRNLIK